MGLVHRITETPETWYKGGLGPVERVGVWAPILPPVGWPLLILECSVQRYFSLKV